MNRRRFLKVAGIGIIGLAVASFIKPDKPKDKPETEDWLEKKPPPIPTRIIKSHSSPDGFSLIVDEWGYWNSSDIIFETTSSRISLDKMAKRLKEIEGKVFNV